MCTAFPRATPRSEAAGEDETYSTEDLSFFLLQSPNRSHAVVGVGFPDMK